MSLWTDVIAYSPTWVDIYPEKVRRFVATVAERSLPASLIGVSEPQVSCYGVLDVDGKAHEAAVNADINALYEKLVTQADRFEQLDSDATGEYDPPSWTEDSAQHVGSCLCAQGSWSEICKVMASAAKTPFAQLEVSGLRVGEDIVKALSLCGEDSYLELTELGVEVGPTFATFQDEPWEFAGWMQVILCGQGQPHPLTKQQLLDRALQCEPLQRIIRYAGECFGIPKWEWTVSCRG